MSSRSCRHHAAKRHVVRRLGILLRDLGRPARAGCVRSAPRRSLIADRSGGGGDSRGADFIVIDERGQFLRLRARGGKFSAQRGGRFLQRLDARRCRRIGCGGRRRAGLGLDAGDARGQTVDRGRVDLRRAARRRSPRSIPGTRPRRAPARRDGAGHRRRNHREHRRRRRRPGCSDRAARRRPALRVSPDTSVASSRWSAARRLGRPDSGRGPVSSGLSSTITAVPCLAIGRNLAGFGGSFGATPLALLARSGPQRTVQRLEQGIFIRRPRHHDLGAPASRTTEATASDMQHCGIASAEISTPAARAASRNARALRLE